MAEKMGVTDYIRAAECKLTAAREECEVGVYPSAVLDACFVTDNLINAFLMAIGTRPAKRHRWTLAIINAVKQRDPKLFKVEALTRGDETDKGNRGWSPQLSIKIPLHI
jgi:HEPN domain-containing protein